MADVKHAFFGVARKVKKKGKRGPQGDRGPKGDPGPQGIQGAQGDRGPRGAQGDHGPQGIQGAQGDRGAQGAQGIQGTQGEKGPKGDNGTAEESGGLGWNRLRLTIQPLATMSIDTGIGGENLVEGEPPLGTEPSAKSLPPFPNPTGEGDTALLVPAAGARPASRLMVIPLTPINSWASVTLPTEPFWNTATATVWITLVNTDPILTKEVNLLVWDPLRRSPGKTDTYTSGAA